MNEKLLALEAALRLNEWYPVRFLDYGTKKAAHKNPRALTNEELAYWMSRKLFNIGIELGTKVFPDGTRLMAVDTDSQSALAFAEKSGVRSPMVNQTQRGFHYLLRSTIEGAKNRIKVKECGGCDFLFNGHLTVSPSVRADTGWRYSWKAGIVPPHQLPLFRQDLLPREPQVKPRIEIDYSSNRVRRARAYVSRMEGAVSGQGGHNRTFRVACVLRRQFGLSLDEAWPVMVEWNEKCDPPWLERDLLRKLTEAGKEK